MYVFSVCMSVWVHLGICVCMWHMHENMGALVHVCVLVGQRCIPGVYHSAF